MAIIDELNRALLQRNPNNFQQRPQGSAWVQDLINAHAVSQTGGRLKREPIGFNFKRDPFDPSSYYDSLGQIKGISTAGTEVQRQMTANKLAQQQAADERARQNAVNQALQGINPNYSGGSGFSKHYHLKGIASDVASAADDLGSRFGIKTIYGLGPGSVPGSDHPKGLALDFMINNLGNGHATGNNLANFAIQNYRSLNVKYVIWNRYIWHPKTGWQPYHGPSDHTDHVHVSFNS